MARSLIALIGMAGLFALSGCVSDGNVGKDPSTGTFVAVWRNPDNIRRGRAWLDTSDSKIHFEFTIQNGREICRGTLERETEKVGHWTAYCNKGQMAKGEARFVRDGDFDHAFEPFDVTASYPGELRVLGTGANAWKHEVRFLIRGLDGWAK